MDKSTLLSTAQKLGLSGAALNPGDIARMTDPNFSLSLSGEALIDRLGDKEAPLDHSASINEEEEQDSWQKGREIGNSNFDGSNKNAHTKRGGDIDFQDDMSDSVSLSLPASFYDDFNEEGGSDNSDTYNRGGQYYRNNDDSDSDSDQSEDDSCSSYVRHGKRSTYSTKKKGFRNDTSVSSQVRDALPPRGMISQMQQQITTLLENTRTLESKLGEERLAKATALAEAENERITSEKSYQSTLQQHEGKISRLLSQINQQKSVFHDLDISESTFEELKQTPTDDLSIREFVCMRIFSDRRESRLAISSLKLQVEKLLEERSQSMDQFESMKREHQRVLSLCQQKEEMLTLEGSATESHLQELRRRLDASETKILDMEPKSREYEAARDRLIKAEIEIQALKEQTVVHVEALKSASTSERSAKSRCSDLEHQVNYLEMDKKYLSNEVSKANTRAERAEQNTEHITTKMRELENSREQLMLELSMSRQSSTTAYEERLSVEMMKQREAMNKELANIQKSLSETHQRECDVLREARDHALSESERCRDKQSELSAEVEKLNQQFHQENMSKENTIAELRAEVKMREFELSKLSLQHEVKLSELNDANSKITLQKKQVMALESEFRRLELSSSQSTDLLERQLKELQDQLNQYQTLEAELDASALLEGEFEYLDKENRRESTMETSHQQGSFTDNINQSSFRRKQIVSLSKKLISNEKKLKEVQLALNSAGYEKDDLVKKIVALNKQVELMNQPTKFMALEMEKYHSEVQRLDKELGRANQKIAALNSKANEEQTRRLEAENDLSKLMKCKDEIKHLKRMVDNFQLQSPPPTLLSSPHVTRQPGGLSLAHSNSPPPSNNQRQQQHAFGFGVNSQASKPPSSSNTVANAGGVSVASSPQTGSYTQPKFHKRTSPARHS